MRRLASGLAAAAVGIAIVGGAAAAPRPAPPQRAEREALSQPPVRTSIASQRVYFVLPDRYANGDSANDRGGLSGPREVTGFDPADEGWFHGGDYRGLTGDCTSARGGLARLKDLGFTAIWVTPPYRQKFVQGDSAAYHGYWIVDFTTVDPHLGTEQEFGAFVECAHRLGLKVYLDVVVNHTADVIRLAGGTSFVEPSQRPYRDCRGRRFNPARYALRNTFPCLSAARMPRVPSVPAEERDTKAPAWLNEVTRYHNRGDIDFSGCSDVCFEQGDFFGLDDLFTEQPAVADGLAEVYAEWIRRYRIDGFRIDTARHVNRAFFHRWVPRILAAARAAGVPDFELFGEVFLTDAIELAPFVRDRGLPNVLDFPMQDALTRLASGSAPAGGVAARLRDDDYFQGPDGIAHTPPTFLGNHDIGRAALMIRSRSLAAQGDELLRRVLLGHSLLYLLRGAPVEYYGDEFGIIGRGGDRQARQDLFPTQVAQWQSEERVGSGPIATGSSFDQASHPIAEHLKLLAALREAHPVLATGATAVRTAAERVLAVSRVDWAGRREYLAAFNAGTAPATLRARTATPSSAWAPLLGSTSGGVSAADGTLELTVPPLSTVLLRAASPLPVSAPRPPALRVAADNLVNGWRVSASVAGNAPLSVGFAVRRARGTRWQRLATDDSPPYRALLDPARYRRREKVHLVAIARALDGQTAVSRVVPFTVRRR